MAETPEGVERNSLPASDFAEASARALASLREWVPMAKWMIARWQGDDYVILRILDEDGEIEEGDVFHWEESICARMVDGGGPEAAHDLDAVPAYANVPLREQFRMGSYIGASIVLEDGEIFGTVCATDPEKRSPELRDHVPEVRLVAQLLATILAGELRQQDVARRAEQAEADALLDPLTGLGNRRKWDELLEAEEARCKRYGHAASVILVDLDGLKEVNDEHGHAAGDDLLCRTAEVIKASVRSEDVVARLGGDEYGILAVQTPPEKARELVARLRARLAEQRIAASIGEGARGLDSDLMTAWARADAAMYEEKRARQGLAGAAG